MKKMTHVGIVKGASACAPKNYAKPTYLRETPKFWVTEGGTKYGKRDGWPAATVWAHYTLDLTTVCTVQAWKSQIDSIKAAKASAVPTTI